MLKQKIRKLLISIASPVYKFQFYTNLIISQISWFTGKIPEIAGLLIILEKFGFYISGEELLKYGILLTVLLFFGGIVYYALGFYEEQVRVNYFKNPIAKEMYDWMKQTSEDVKEIKRKLK